MRLATCAAALSLLVSAAPAFAQAPPAAPPPEAAPPAELPPPPPPPPPVVEAAPVVAAPAAPAAAPAAPPAKTWKDFVTLEGLADSYWMYNFAHDGSTLNGPQLRNFDVASNSFSLNYLKLGVGAAIENVAFRADLGYGHTAGIINQAGGGMGPIYTPPAVGAAAPPATATLNSQLYSSAFIVQQAYGSATFGLFTLDFGKFTTTAGAEVIEANKNWLYSRSLLFFGIPLVHTGVRGNIKASDQFTLQLGIVNGWNNDPDNNGDKTFEVSANITPSSMINIIATTYFGKEAATGTADAKIRFLGDLVVALTLNDKTALNLNFDYFKDGDHNFFGVAAMGHFVLAEHAALSVRGEYVKSKNDGFLGAKDAGVYEGTVGLSLPFAGHYELRPELRGDFSNKEIFFTGSEAKKNQFTGTVAALAYF